MLKPAHVDRDSGYRHYKASQLPRLNHILDQIATLIDEGVNEFELQGMLRLRRAKQISKIEEESSRLAAIEHRIEEIAREGVPLEVVIKESTPSWIVSVRDVIQTYPEISRLYPEVYGQLGAQAASGTPVAVWHSTGNKASDIEAEASILFNHEIPVSGRLGCYQLPATRVASYVHHGSFQQFKGVYDRLTRWMEETGWHPSGPCREIYLHIGNPARQDDTTYVTEIQFPVDKAL